MKANKKQVKKANPNEAFKRLTDKELRDLEKVVHNDNRIFEECMCGVLNRRAWADLLKEAVKSGAGKKLTKEQKAKLERISKFGTDICNEEAIDLTLEHFSGDVSKNRRRLSVERALRKKESKEPMSAEERLLAEIFSAK